MTGPSRTVYFATQNKGKFAEAALLTARYGIRMKLLPVEKLEIQSDDLKRIASVAAQLAAESSKHVVVAEDAGFFVKALGGFPGPYSSYVFRTLGTRGILKLLEHVRDRRASFKAVVAFCTPRTRPKCFAGSVEGVVSRQALGEQGFGFDPIFIPRERSGRTFSQMSIEEKNALSHRAKAFRKFSQWYSTRI